MEPQRPVVAISYYRPPTPPLPEWEADLRQIAEMGFDAVRLWVYWGWHERRRGSFDWSETDRFFDLAEGNGLGVIPNIILELPPSWRPILHILQTPDGPLAAAHFPSIHLPCFDDPELRRDAEPFVRALVRRYARRQIAHWDVWNEPRSKWDCTCEASCVSYAEWLARRYGSIAEYNRLFGKCFHDWDAVAAYPTGPDWADEFNWRLWAADRLAEQVHWVARLVKECDNHHPVMAHVGICSPIQSVRKDTSVDALTAQGLDFFGSSCDASWESQWYTGEAEGVRPLEKQSGLTRVRLQVDWMRSLSPRNWICELYADHYNAWVTRSPENLLWQFWQVVSRGLAGVAIWEYKVERVGIESLGYGLLGLDGQPNERSRALAGAIRLLKEDLADLFAGFTYREPVVGILYDERSSLLSELEMPRNACLPHAHIHFAATWGLYECLRARNVPVRWVPHQHLPDALPMLRALVLPGHSYLDDHIAGLLARWVQDGGHLVGQAGTGFRQANTWVSTAIPPESLAGVLGVREVVRAVTQQPSPLADAAGRPLGSLGSFRVALECRGSEPLAWFADGAVALARNRAGRGTTAYLGGFLGLDGVDEGRLPELLGLALPDSDPLAECARHGVEAIPWARRSGAGSAYFLFNTGGETATLPEPRTAGGRLTPLFGPASREAGALRLGPNSAAVAW